jgi:hypothetical protein
MRKQLIFPDGTLGYIESPDEDAHTQEIQIDGAAPIDVQEVHVDDDSWHDMLQNVGKRRAVVKKHRGKPDTFDIQDIEDVV